MGKTGRGPGTTARRHAEEEALLGLLEGCLSQSEVARVLAAALLSLDQQGRERLFDRLADDTAATLRRILGTPLEALEEGEANLVRAASESKVRQEWNRAWSDWDTCIAESSDEEGRYVIQEAHWESPYLDTTDLAADLEKIAAHMDELIERVVEDELDPGFSFLDAVCDGVDEIGIGLAEWFDEPEWLSLFGPRVTSCLLRWQWLSARRSADTPRKSAFDIIDEIRRVEAAAERWSLDREALRQFVLGLEDRDQQEIVAGLESNRGSWHWAGALTQTWSPWFEVYHQLCERWDPSRHLTMCREQVASDWTLAMPLLEDCLVRRAFDEAKLIVEEALSALLHHNRGQTWHPTQNLLVDQPAVRYGWGLSERVTQFLELWSRIAEASSEDELHHALSLQAVFIEQWDDWDAVLEAISHTETAGFGELAERLFKVWRRMVVERSFRYQPGSDQLLQPSWVSLLADAARKRATSAETFERSLRGWLAGVGQSAASFQKARSSLEVLTTDLGDSFGLSETSPSLHRRLSAVPDSKLAASRRSWLERLDAFLLFDDIVALWKRWVVALLPDPAKAHKSRYDHCAEWLAVVHELNPEAYEKVVRQWRQTHGRRRNLWKAISARGLPLTV